MKTWKYLPNREKQRIKQLLEKIRNEIIDDYNWIHYRDIKKIKRGTLLCTGVQMGNCWPDRDILKYIGYTCQIRLSDGDYLSDEIFLRHLDGSLTPHSNQTFFKIKRKNYKKLIKLFSKLIIEETDRIWNKNYFYRDIDGIVKYGYIVENKEA